MNRRQAAILRSLKTKENEAWMTMTNGPESDACATPGQEGKNYLAWRMAADACRKYHKRLPFGGAR